MKLRPASGRACAQSDVACSVICGPAGRDRAGKRRGLGGDPGRGGHSPAPCFSRSVVELAGPELSFDSSVGSETKISFSR